MTKHSAFVTHSAVRVARYLHAALQNTTGPRHNFFRRAETNRCAHNLRAVLSKQSCGMHEASSRKLRRTGPISCRNIRASRPTQSKTKPQLTPRRDYQSVNEVKLSARFRRLTGLKSFLQGFDLRRLVFRFRFFCCHATQRTMGL